MSINPILAKCSKNIIWLLINRQKNLVRISFIKIEFLDKNWPISWNQGTGNWTSKKWQMKSNQDQKRWSITSIFWQLCLYVFKVFFSIFQTPKMTTISQAAKSCDLYLSTFMKPLCAPQCLIKCNFLIHLALSEA